MKIFSGRLVTKYRHYGVIEIVTTLSDKSDSFLWAASRLAYGTELPTASQATHEIKSSTLAPDGRVPADVLDMMTRKNFPACNRDGLRRAPIQAEFSLLLLFARVAVICGTNRDPRRSVSGVVNYTLNLLLKQELSRTLHRLFESTSGVAANSPVF
jgi:hypothetical protein